MELVPGYGVLIKAAQLNNLKWKSKSASALLRNLLMVYFYEATLANSCDKGTKDRKLQDSKPIEVSSISSGHRNKYINLNQVICSLILSVTFCFWLVC